jgi:host factor-I protein
MAAASRPITPFAFFRGYPCGSAGASGLSWLGVTIPGRTAPKKPAGSPRKPNKNKNNQPKANSMAKSPAKLQDAFLAHVAKGHAPITVFLTNGVKLSGTLTWVDDECLTLSRDGVTQLVYKHAIATVMPTDAISIYDIMGQSA